jgi:hypothetical protein
VEDNALPLLAHMLPVQAVGLMSTKPWRVAVPAQFHLQVPHTLPEGTSTCHELLQTPFTFQVGSWLRTFSVTWLQEGDFGFFVKELSARALLHLF